METKEQALNLLIKAVEVAQAKGAYTLEEASLIASAVKVFTQPTVKEEDVVKEKSKKD